MEDVTASSAVTVTLLLGAVAAILAYLKFKPGNGKKLAPGPRGVQALRDMLSAMREGSVNTQAELWSRQYGPLVLCRSAFGDLCVLNSPQLIRELYAGKDYENLTVDRPRSFIGWFGFYDFHDVSTSSPGHKPEWSKMRRLFHQALKFYGDGVERMESRVHEELRRLIKELEANCGHAIDMDQMISTSIIRIVLTLATGECPEPELATLAKRFDALVNELYSPILDTVLTAFPWLRHLPFLPYKQLCRDFIDSRDQLMEKMFTQPKATWVRGHPRGIVDVLLDELQKEDWMTEDHIKGLLADTVSAAYLTSAQTIKALFLYLLHNPEAVVKIQNEVDTKLGQRTPRIQDRSDLPYVGAVVLETLRLACPVSLGLPHLTADDVTLDGYTIPKGTTVFANYMAFSRDPDNFTDPEAFKPERFLDDNGQLLPANHPLRQKMVAFSVGKRACVAENFARSRVFLYVTTLLQRFDVLPPKEHKLLPAEPSSWKNGIVRVLKPYHIVFKTRTHTQPHLISNLICPHTRHTF